MEYNFKEIEKRWHQYWVDNKTYKVSVDCNKPKFYVLDMFPYPSGAGLHVGHPLGYIASDIISRYKRLKGFNVLHPMGYDAYGLPAEQYAIQTGQHPAVTTEQNIKRYREQLDRIGFSFDWDREIRTCEPEYYHWTQWAFIQMFNSYYDTKLCKAQPIENLVKHFEQHGSEGASVASSDELEFSAHEWKGKTEHAKQDTLLNYRIAYLSDTKVNWCAALGTVLANDEVINGLSERGGHPVEQRMMRQWSLRVSAYAERLLNDLEKIDWSESIKETQRNWIGKSVGAELHLPLAPSRRGGTEDSPYHTTNKIDWHSNVDNAQEHRKNPTEAENALWQMLRNKNIDYKFRRQHLVDRFIVDFVCLEAMLVVEVDGAYHNNSIQTAEDDQRTRVLEDLGYRILRFTNEEVINETDRVLNKIKVSCSTKVPSTGGDLGEVVVFTTRPDTIFGVTFMVLAPESDYVAMVTTVEQKAVMDDYVAATKKRTERDRQVDKTVSGVFTGSYAINPMNGEEVPIWVSDYVLAGYGTGAIMAVPAHDSRDYTFAKHFGLEIRPLIAGADVSQESFDAKEGIMINSDFLNGLTVAQAIEEAKKQIKEKNLGRLKTNYRLRDAIFSRQRYWGEPFPVYYKESLPYMLPLDKLPLKLPEVDKYLPTETGEPPLGRAAVWAWDEVNQVVVDKTTIDNKTIFPLELNTMPGFAGSSAYYLRYMDPHNDKTLVDKEVNEYWENVDLYIGGTEHATGHLIYSRMWNKFLFDIGHSANEEPFKKLVNQGMIQGVTSFVYRINGTNKFVSHGLKDQYDVTPIRVSIDFVSDNIMDTNRFKNWRPEFANAEFVLEDEQYICGSAVEKMSKSYHNVVNPDNISDNYGADTLRLYEMFLGPLEYSKPWDTKGIDGVHRFLRRVWNLFYQDNTLAIADEAPNKDELKALHKLIKKVDQDIDNFSFNTSVSAFMICVNELTAMKCNNKSILTDFVKVLSPFAPFVTEELWKALSNTQSICLAEWPVFNETYLVEDEITYAISFNGKARFNLTFGADANPQDVENAVLAHADTLKWIDGKPIKKVIVVPNKIVNIVL